MCEADAAAPIDTDGPDYVDSSEVVPEQRFQYELDAYSASRSGNADLAALASTPLLLKYGIAKDWELRADFEGYQSQAGHQGPGNTLLGAKWHSQDSDPGNYVPAVSWIAELKAPTGSPYFRSTGVLPALRSVITWDFPYGHALGLMPGIVELVDAQGRRYTAATFGAAMNKRIGEKTRLFVELSMPVIAPAAHGGTIAQGDIGGAYLLTDDTQIGFRSGAGLNRNAPRRYLLLELAQRF